MSRRQVIYQVENLFVGPSPNNTGHSLNEFGAFSNTGIFNLLSPINRVQTASYSIDTVRTDILQVGKRSYIDRPNITWPTVNLDFSYLQHGIINERNLGLYVNYTDLIGANSGRAHYGDNFQVCVLSGFIDRNLTPEENADLGYPFTYKDKKNIFIGIEREGADLNTSGYQRFHPNITNLGVLAFGNCYMNRYNARAQVGQFPTVSVGFECENMMFLNTASGDQVPTVYSESGQLDNNLTFSLPSTYQGANLPSVLLPGDITLDITSLPPQKNIIAYYGTGISGGLFSSIDNLNYSFNDIKIQSYNLDLSFPRSSLFGMGYRLPVDRQINFPVFSKIDLETIVGDNQTGSLVNLITGDAEYNLTIKLRNPANKPVGTAVRYDFLRAKFSNVNYNSSIGPGKTATFSFSVPVDDQDYSRGFFMSGMLNVDLVQRDTAFLLLESGDYFLLEDGGKMLLRETAFF